MGDERRRNGLIMSRLNCFKWLKQAGLLSATQNLSLTRDCYNKIASPAILMNMIQFEKFIDLLASKTQGWTKDSMMKKLVDCGDPDQKTYKLKNQPERQARKMFNTITPSHQAVPVAKPWKSARVRFQLAEARRKQFVQLFKAYAKVGDRRNNGFVMSKYNAMMWFRHANIVGSSMGEDAFQDCFRNVVQTKLEVNVEEMRCVIICVGKEISKKPDEVLTMLLNCNVPQQRGSNNTSSEAKSIQAIGIKDVPSSSSSGLRCLESSPRCTSAIKNFEALFRMYSKLDDKSKSGIIISKLNTLLWFHQAGLLEESDSHLCVLDSFQQVARTQTVINKTEFEKFLKIYSSRKFRSCQDLVMKLVCCGKPDFTDIKKKKTDLMRKASSFRDVRNAPLQTPSRSTDPRLIRLRNAHLPRSHSLPFKN